MNKNTLAAVTALAITVAGAHATVIDYSATFSNKAIGGATFNVPLPQFQASFGTLTQVEFRIENLTTANTSLVFDNEGSAGAAAFKLDTQIHAQTGNSLLSNAFSNSTLTKSGSVAADNDAAADFTGTDSLALIGGTNAPTGSFVSTASNYLHQFTTTNPTNQFFLRISSGFTSPLALTSNGAGVSGVFSTPSQTFSGTAHVFYTFSPLAPVPEAGTALFGAAMGLTLAFRRMRAGRA